MKIKRYRKVLLMLLCAAAAFTCVYGFYETKESIPDKIYYCEDEERPLDNLAENPFVTYSTEIPASGSGSYKISCELFDMIPLKTVKAEKVSRQSVYACAAPVGIYMETKGVLIVDAGEVENQMGELVKPAEHLVQPGDYIQKIDGKVCENKKELLELVKQSGGKPMILTLLRDGDTIEQRMVPVLSPDGAYHIGVWVRDNIQGIGTLTYINQDGSYGALGHGISDVDTGKLLRLGNGELYQADILDIVPGREGNPGELQGVIHYQQEKLLGTISKNTPVGIFGEVNPEEINLLASGNYEVAMKQELVEGEASILCSVEGTHKEYKAVISNIDMSQCETNKCFQIRITDPELLEKTGGIVQGMSGSPILQNGKLVGAVTHVLVQDSTRGYGVFMETMIEASKKE